jgi:glycosyltransferase involved in cell wall biosynthesis
VPENNSTGAKLPSRILFISHCDFTGNSALHVLAICNELFERGMLPSIAVPDHPETVGEVGRPPYPVVSYDTAADPYAIYPDGRPPDLIHAFTPREHVRRLTETICNTLGSPYVVHLEDNEDAVTRDEIGPDAFASLFSLPLPLGDRLISPWRAHPVRARRFIAAAAGVTAIVDTLLETKAAHVPGAWFWPGYDRQMLVDHDRVAIRSALGLEASDLILAYTGNIHQSNVSEVRSLYVAVGLLRRAGFPIRLIKTGWNHVDMSWMSDCGVGDGLVDLGFVSRERLSEIIAVAEIFVQPGSPNEFNDYRFPSKIPDFLVSATPAVLPATNLGRYLTSGDEAILLTNGDAREIFTAVATLAGDPTARMQIGLAGRSFALEHLDWTKNVDRVTRLYSHIVANGSSKVTVASPPMACPDPPVKLVAFYLPQFHPIPENDEWWGDGFTEWTNVRRATPSFPGHFQPQLPAGEAFYDLRDPSVLASQAEMARRHGIYGFCFYYYWFDGRRILERPLIDMLARDEPAFPFCYCWANENWTRRWDGLDSEVLLKQEFSAGWASRFIRDLLPVLTDARYIRVRGAPLLLVYRANLVPDIEAVAEQWRSIALDEGGIELHLAAVQSFGITDPRRYGLDAAVEFPPHTERFLLPHSRVRGLDQSFAGYLEDYQAVMHDQLRRDVPAYAWYRGVMPSWDNTARRGREAHVLVGSSPASYQTWLRKLVLQALIRSDVDEPFVFINAWNEWAEGTHLEPDVRYGSAWLEATRSALRDGVRQFHSTRGWDLNEHQADEYISETLPLI